jgi:hypothetical protein
VSDRGTVSLDWFSVGILATGLPLAFQEFGPWVGTNAVYAVCVCVLPRFILSSRLADGTRVGALVAGTVLFLYARYGGLVAPLGVPDPATALALSMNRLLTRPELTTIPFLRHTQPRRDPVVVTSAAFGTAFSLVVVALWTGAVSLVP